MASILSMLETEVLRPFATLVIPGVIVFGPIALLFQSQPFIANWTDTHGTEWLFLLSCGIIFTGLIIESVASHLEDWWDGKLDKANAGQHVREWYDYLRLAFEVEPVGHRYLRTRVLQLKFELNAGVAFSASALLFLFYAVQIDALIVTFVLTPFCGGLAGLLLTEAKNTHKLLAKTRTEILKGIVRVPREGPA